MQIIRKSLSTMRFVSAYRVANLQAAMEYRVSFWTRVISMLANDCLWLFFWWSYFQQFPLVNGWRSTDVIVLWSITACGFGLSDGIFGNTMKLPQLIINGGLDAYLSMPRSVLLHACIAQTTVSAWGDVLFGFGTFFVLLHPGIGLSLLFIVLAVLAAIIVTAFFIIVGSLAFFLGNTEGLSGQMLGILVSFSTYPMNIFHGFARLLLFTVLPAGFISFVPLQLLHQFSWPLFGAMVGVVVVLVLTAVGFFQLGLRRYESGNLLGMQG